MVLWVLGVGVLERGVALLLLPELFVGVGLLLVVLLVMVLEAAEEVVVVMAARVNKNDRACDHRTVGSSAQWLMRVSSDRRDRAMSRNRKGGARQGKARRCDHPMESEKLERCVKYGVMRDKRVARDLVTFDDRRFGYLSDAFLRGCKTQLPRTACLRLPQSKAWNKSSRWVDSRVRVRMVMLLMMVVLMMMKERQ